MKKYFFISLLFIALINSGAGCGSNSDQVIAPLAPNYLGLWGTNFDSCTPTTGFSILDIEETLEISEDKIVYLQPDLTSKKCQGLNSSNYGIKAEFTYTVDKDNVIKITKTNYIQTLSNGVYTNTDPAKALGIWKGLPEQLFNKELTSKFTCDGKTLKFDTFGNPSYLKRK
jgi:hypothetical protein